MSLSNIQECQVGMETMPEAWSKKILNIKFTHWTKSDKRTNKQIQGEYSSSEPQKEASVI